MHDSTWFLKGSPEPLLIFLLTAEGIKKNYGMTRFATKHSYRILFFQCIVKTYFDGRQTQPYFTRRNDSQNHFCLSSLQWHFFSLVTVRLTLRKYNYVIITVHDKDCSLQQLPLNQDVTFVYTQQG